MLREVLRSSTPPPKTRSRLININVDQNYYPEFSQKLNDQNQNYEYEDYINDIAKFNKAIEGDRLYYISPKGECYIVGYLINNDDNFYYQDDPPDEFIDYNYQSIKGCNFEHQNGGKKSRNRKSRKSKSRKSKSRNRKSRKREKKSKNRKISREKKSKKMKPRKKMSKKIKSRKNKPRKNKSTRKH